MRRWLPGRRLVLGVDGGLAAGLLALACVTTQVSRGWRWRWEAARDPPPGAQPTGQRGPKPLKGKRPRRLLAGAARSATPWATVAVGWYGGQRNTLWVFSRLARWSTPGVPPVESRDVLVADPAGKLRLEALRGPDLEATPVESRPGVVRRWAGEVTCAEGRAHLDVATPRPRSDRAIARPTPVLLARFSLATVRRAAPRGGRTDDEPDAAARHRDLRGSACMPEDQERGGEDLM